MTAHCKASQRSCLHDGLLASGADSKLAIITDSNQACKHASRLADRDVSRLASQHANMQACQPVSKPYCQHADWHDSRMDCQSVSLLACWPGEGEPA
jgi:hypothetical protein